MKLILNIYGPDGAIGIDHPDKIEKKNLRKMPTAIDILSIFLYSIRVVCAYITMSRDISTNNQMRETFGCFGTVGHRQVSFFMEGLYPKISKNKKEI
jgi:hypothetical protein